MKLKVLLLAFLFILISVANSNEEQTVNTFSKDEMSQNEVALAIVWKVLPKILIIFKDPRVEVKMLRCETMTSQAMDFFGQNGIEFKDKDSVGKRETPRSTTSLIWRYTNPRLKMIISIRGSVYREWPQIIVTLVHEFTHVAQIYQMLPQLLERKDHNLERSEIIAMEIDASTQTIKALRELIGSKAWQEVFPGFDKEQLRVFAAQIEECLQKEEGVRQRWLKQAEGAAHN